MKRKMRRRVGGIVLASTMMISTIPATAIAADENSVDLVDINPSSNDADTLVVTNVNEDTTNNTLDAADMNDEPDTRNADSTNWIDVADTTWYNESDTEFTIDTAKKLAGLAKLVNEGNDFSKKTIKLGENIDLDGKEWTPIGTSSNVFSGTFDGQSHTISNLSINKPNSTHQGLFGYIKGNGYTNYLVTDLELNNVNIIGNNYTGALSGQAFTCGIENVTVSGNVIGGRYVGGLIGHVYTRFNNCQFTGSVTGAYSAKDQIGGIAGSGDGRFYNCTAIQGDDCEYLVKGDCWNGGIIGGGQEGTCAVDCYVKGDIVNASEWYGCSGAGIAGEAGMSASCTFTGNYFDGTVYCGDEVVDAPIIGLVNTGDTNVLSNMTVEGNSWNTENYPADLTVAVAAMDDKPFDDIVAEATRTEPRNMNLVGSISDLEYMEAGNLTIVGTEVTIEKLQEFAANSGGAYEVTVDSNAGIIKIKKVVAKINDTTYSTLEDAITAAMNGADKTISLLSDVKIDTWNQVWDIDGLTIEGNNHTITIDKVESNVNGNYLFYDAKNLNVSDLTIKFNTNGNGFSMISGKLDNVKMYGGENSNYAVFVGSSNDSAAKVEISNCLFDGFKGTAVYSQPATSESATSTISVDKTTFTNCGMTMCSYAPNTSFTNNIVTGGSEVSFAAAAENADRNNTYTITGNTFENAGKIWFYGADLKNVNFEKNAVTGKTTISTEEAKGTLDASGNYWGEGADLAEIAKKLVGSVNIDSYYTDAEMTNEDEVQVGGILVATAEQLENAIANAKAGDVIVLAPGTYEVDKLVFDASKSNITIKGSGMEQTTLKSKSGQYIVEIKDLNQTVSGLKFEDLTLDGDNKASVLVKVDSQTKCGDITFNRVAFKNATQSGINVASGDATVETGTITVSGCAFSEINGGSASAYGIYAARGNLKVEKSKFNQIDSTNGTGAGVLFDTANFGDQSYNLSVTDSEFTKITGTDSDQKGTGGVTVTGPNKIDTLVITGNTFADNTTDIRIGKSDAAPVIETVTVENNGNAQIVVPDEDAKYFTATFICDEQMLSKSLSDRNGEIVTPSAPSKEDYKFKGWQSSINGKIYDSDTAVVLTDDTTFTAVWDRISSGGASHPEAGGSSSSSDRYEISKPSDVENGSIKVSDTKAEKGDTVTITVTPDEGYELDELAVYDEDGDKIDLKDKGDGKFTFEMPKGDVEIEVSFAAISDETPKADFVDVPADAWYAEAVQYVYENGMMSGTSETTFSPDLTTTRGMIVTILYRLENEPTVTGTTAFTDVAADQYYANAVAWAAQNGIVSGIDATTFAPNNAITREQMAAILYRYAQFKGYDVSAKADLSVYTDAAQVSTYATDAMAWANGAELITGTSATTLSPAGNATRAQVATILMRFCENIAK